MHRTLPGRRIGVAAAAALLLAGVAAPARAQTTGHDAGTIGAIDRNDPRFDKLIPPGAKIEKLAEGFDWSEGAAWDRKDRSVVFSDVPRNHALRWREGDRAASVFLDPSGYTGTTKRGGEPGSNGLLFDAENRLVLCQHGDRRVARLEADGKFTTLADQFEGKRFNSPNDAVYHSDGSLFFTDPSYGLEGGNKSPLKEIPHNGVYRRAKDGTVTLVTKELSFPNGIGLSPDEKTLYVANSDSERAIWMAFPLNADGTVGPGRVFFDATRGVKTLKGLPDGLKVDKAGNIWATGPGGVLVFDPDGTHLGTLATGEANGNVAFGGEDGSTLFICADMYLARVRTTTKGKGF